MSDTTPDTLLEPEAERTEESSPMPTRPVPRGRITWADPVLSPASAASAPGSAASAPGSAHLAPEAAVFARQAVPKAQGSVASAPVSAHHAPEGVAAPPSKRQRVLKLMNSGDLQLQEETDIDHWEELVTKLRKAAKAGHIWSGDTSCSSTVHFWAVQVVAAMKSANDSTAAAAPGSAALASDSTASSPGINLCLKLFPDFLLNTLYTQKCFKVLKHFIPIFEDLVKLGCAAPVELDKLKAFAEHSTHDLKAPVLADFSSGDLKQRVKFFGSVLFKDFNETRCSALLEKVCVFLRVVCSPCVWCVCVCVCVFSFLS